jgi:proteasome accessory factor A
MQRRIYGLETEYGVTCTQDGVRTLTPDEVARHLFRKVVSWGRSSNVFLTNGSRLYLDVGSHPEYATAECDDITTLIAHDRAGERILEDLIVAAQERMKTEEVAGDIYLFKNNTDSSGNSYGCHENFLIARKNDFLEQLESLLPFLISRQLIAGAGKVLLTPRGPIYSFSQRADHMWEGVSSATTRSRPIINTRDEPHADADSYRRLHVIVGDSNMSEITTMLKVATMDLVLRVMEEVNGLPKIVLENPMRAIRDISHDLTGRATVTLEDGRTLTALELQREYLAVVTAFAQQHEVSVIHKRAIELWERTLNAIESQNFSTIDREIDWAIKWKLVSQYALRNNLELNAPRIAQLDLAYHDITRSRGLFHLLDRKNLVDRLVDDAQIETARTVPPQTTRAKLRGDFLLAAAQHNVDVTVDWVHLKLNDQSQRTVMCKDPFANEDERVARLVESFSEKVS